MASPQKERGFTPVAHEILEEICTYGFNASQLSIIMTIWRYTYGFNRIKHDFSLSFFQQATQLSDKAVRKELTFLIDSKVVKVHAEATRTAARVLSFNKDYEKWMVPKRGGGKNMEQMSLFDSEEVGNNCTTPQGDEVGNNCTRGYGTIVPEGVGNNCTSKKEKDLKESIKEIIDIRFNEFWSFYPKKVGKVAAFKHFTRIHKVKGFSWDDFVKGTKAYVEYCQRTDRFLKDGSAFVNQETYKDFLDELPIPSVSTKTKNSTRSEKNKSALQKAMEAFNNEQDGSPENFGGDLLSLPKFRSD